MGNGCNKISRTRNGKFLFEKSDEFFNLMKDNDSSRSDINDCNDIFTNKIINKRIIKKNKGSVYNENCYFESSSFGCSDDMHYILENEKRMVLKKVDNSKVENYLIIKRYTILKKYIKIYKNKKKKSLNIDIFSSLSNKDDDNIQLALLNRKKNTQSYKKNSEEETRCSLSDIFLENDENKMFKDKNYKL
ncbi:conserved Plasmodium protein, unknown function [Plasmodium gallinaceum]|uniref:Uncharacterized protein n=1 Tax=Plasmodium gallinaceum TaxID=5849 RepID=A0A1J1GZC5_PLAGA|nr:conserved Plasmodium protein, unknown function [Plasmodium gallinaceum]CRG97800.1 conserved Plasmodium protein, unknown function [Plasmodium gallinaceum]